MILNENPVLPAAVAAILPLVLAAVVGLVAVPVTVIVIPEQGLGGSETVIVALPVQPDEFFATIVYAPAASPENKVED